MEKLRITEYFDSIINEIDLVTETKIKQNQSYEDFYNERRQKQIEILKKIEREALNGAIKSEESGHVEKRFWSVVEFADTWFLVRSNKVIGSEEKDFFRVLLRWPNSFVRERLQLLSELEPQPDFWIISNDPDIEIDVGFDLSQFRIYDCLVIDISPWLDREFNLEEVRFRFDGRGSLGFNPKPINSLFRIKTLHISIRIYEPDETNSRAEELDQIIKCFGRVGNVILEINCSDKAQIDKIIESLSSKSIHEKLSILLNTRVTDQMTSLGSSFFPHLNRIELIRSSPSWFSSADWSHVKEVDFDNVPLKDLESANFSTLRSLKTLFIRNLKCHQTHFDWTFLDPVRENIERFVLYDVDRISWKAFRQMHKLKDLSIDFASSSALVEFDSQRQLFADLHELNELYLDLIDALRSKQWTLDLPNLENLSLRPVLSKKEEKAVKIAFLISFNLPKLVNLSLGLLEYPLNMDISFLTAPFYGVHELQLNLHDLSYMKRGCFREFKSLRMLTLYTLISEEVDSKTFIGLEHLVQLILETGHTKPGALSRLENLQMIHFRTWNEENILCDYKRLFDGLVSLKEIIFGNFETDNRFCQAFESFVYYENLNKFVLENRFREIKETTDENEESTFSEDSFWSEDDDDIY